VLALVLLGAIASVRVMATVRRPVVITVRSNPPGASAFYEGEYMGVTPFQVSLTPGEERLLRLMRRDYADGSTIIRAGDFQPKTFREKCNHLLFGRRVAAPVVTLTSSARARLSITSDPSGADVFLDGRRIGVAPLSRAGLEPGVHTVYVAMPEFYPWEKKVELESAAEVLLRCELQSKWAAVYRERILKHSKVLDNYVELAHEYVLRGKFKAAEEVLWEGVEIMVKYGGHSSKERFVAEIYHTHLRDYLYPDEGADESLRLACLKIMKAMIDKNLYDVKSLRSMLHAMEDRDRSRRRRR
jgi:hypothetical protein